MNLEMITKGNIQNIAGNVKVKYFMGRVGSLRRWPLFTAKSEIDDEGKTTTLHCPKILTDKLGVDNPLYLCQNEIGLYAKDFEPYVVSLLKESGMYVARALWHNDSSLESLDHAQKIGVKRRVLRGILYQERL